MSQVVLGVALFLVLFLAVVVIAKYLVNTFHQLEKRAQKPASDPNPLPRETEKGTLASLQQLTQAQPGSFWIITRTSETEHSWHEIFVRGEEIRMEQVGALLQEGSLTAFDRANPQHKRVLLAVLHGANGIMARLAREEEIGWGGGGNPPPVRSLGHCAAGPASEPLPERRGNRAPPAGFARYRGRTETAATYLERGHNRDSVAPRFSIPKGRRRLTLSAPTQPTAASLP